jgi:hypothetical protein
MSLHTEYIHFFQFDNTLIGPNLALAFGIGFGFDKIFEAWGKAPKRVEIDANLPIK